MTQKNIYRNVIVLVSGHMLVPAVYSRTMHKLAALSGITGCREGPKTWAIRDLLPQMISDHGAVYAIPGGGLVAKKCLP